MQNMGFLLLLSLLYYETASGTTGALWPIPQHISGTGVPFPVSPAFSILSHSKSEVLERGIARSLEIITKQITLHGLANEASASGGERLELLHVNVASDNENLSLETSYQYNLTVNAGKAQVDAASPYGALYGLETFSQLVVKRSLLYSEVHITDYPEYVHRGLMLDTGVNSLSRHFYLNILSNNSSGLWTDIAVDLNAVEKKMLLGGEMPLWTDEYCYRSQCIHDKATTAGWMYYGPKYDAQFMESIWPRGIVGAGPFWNYQSQLDFESAEFKLRYQQQQRRFMERGIMACPIDCICGYNNRCGEPYPTPRSNVRSMRSATNTERRAGMQNYSFLSRIRSFFNI